MLFDITEIFVEEHLVYGFIDIPNDALPLETSYIK